MPGDNGSSSQPNPSAPAERDRGSVQGSTLGGLAGVHAQPPPLVALVATADQQQKNTIRPTIFPFACWRMEDMRFEFDCSFVGPGSKDDLALLHALCEQHPGAPLSIYGHADPVGDEAYNKALSGRRARAVWALLARDANAWEDLYTSPQGGDDWKKTSIQTMLGALGYHVGPGPASTDAKTKQAVKDFQKAQGLSDDGIPGPLTRAKLFPKYMDLLCTPDFLVPRDRFLGKGQDSDGKGDYQGCGEANPVLMFAQAEKQELDKPANHAKRNVENSPNRRVVVYLFKPGAEIEVSKWVCPRAGEGPEGCRKRFFADAAQRRQNTGDRRTHESHDDTFQCRFYHRLSVRSPCEKMLKTFLIRVYDPYTRVLPFAPFRLRAGGQTITGVADASGYVIARDVEVPSDGVIEWSYRQPGSNQASDTQPDNYAFKLALRFDADAAVEKEHLLRRMHNLGYAVFKTEHENVRLFQQNYGLPLTGKLDDVKDAVVDYHDAGDPAPIIYAKDPTEYDDAGDPDPEPAHFDPDELDTTNHA